jgi:hypothetical protein
MIRSWCLRAPGIGEKDQIMTDDNDNHAEMLTAAQVREITGMPVSTLHDWTAKRERGIEGRAHRRCTLGLPERRVLVSRKWFGKTLPDHRADREEFVRQLLASAGTDKPDRNHDNVLIYRVDSGDRYPPLRDELIIRAVAQCIAWRTEYDKALLAAGPSGGQQVSATG